MDEDDDLSCDKDEPINFVLDLHGAWGKGGKGLAELINGETRADRPL